MFYVLFITQGLLLWVASTIAFDAIHWLLHVFEDSRFALLRKLGSLHTAHHDFLDEDLKIHDDKNLENILMHMLPEMVTRVIVSSAGYLFMDPLAVSLVLLSHVIFFFVQVYTRGRDLNHFEPQFLKSPRAFPFVDPSYHLLHHKHPKQYFSSMVRLFDMVFGKGCQIKDKRILITGASGAFGAPLKEILEREATVTALSFGKDWDYDDYSIFEKLLPETDILVLAHGSKVEHAMEANCDSFVTIIDKMIEEAKGRTSFTEVWALGSEIECHPHFGVEELRVYKASKDAYAKHARSYYHARAILYRHIVPSAFSSRMGPGLISGKTAARIAMFLIRRGFHYIPVTYTGIALLNYPFYLFGARPKQRATFMSASPGAQPIDSPAS